MLLVLATATAAFAQFDEVAKPNAGFGDSRDKVKVSIIAARSEVLPGSDVPFAIIFDQQHGWHIHTNEIKNVPSVLGDASFLIKTQIAATAPSESGVEVHAGFVQWPKRDTINLGTKEKPEPYDVYEGKAIAYLPVTIRSDAKPGEVKVDFKITYQACGKINPFDDAESCLAPVMEQPFSVTLTILDPAAPTRGSSQTADAATFGEFDASIWPRIRSGEKAPQIVKFDLFALSFDIDASGTAGKLLLWLVAAVGGFMLNLTPCVLPVIPLKILGLSQSAGNRAKCFALGATMSLGVIAFWLVLGIIIASVSGFTATNQLFQYPAFTIGVGIIIAVMAVGMCGLFSIQLPNWVYMVNPKHDSLSGSFGFGIMTAVLSTPCTAPFMGAAAAWAATQEPATTLITFGAIGAGMAIPYLVLSAFPALVSKMPRTGPANELLKQVMGLFMLAAAVYFIGVGLSGVLQTPPDPPTRMYWWPVMGLIIAAGAWMTWRMVKIAGAAPRTFVLGTFGLLFIAGGIYGGFALTDAGRIKWVYYTPERFEQAMKEGNVVVLEFTAEWCLNCKALERTVLNSDGVVSAVEQKGVVPMKVDLTGNNGPGNLKLKETGSVSIPWLVIYSPDNRKTLESAFYTVDQVVQAVASAKGPAATAKR